MNAPIAEVLAAMIHQRILVIGDIMLDRFVYGRTDRVSPEAPALVLAAERQEQMLGGASNVALNLIALGAQCILVGLVGADETGAQIIAELARFTGIDARLTADPARSSTLKVRFVNPQYNTHLLRLDWEETRLPDGNILADLIAVALAAVAEADVVILSDYRKGVLQPALVQAVIAAAATRGIPVVVDPKGRDFGLYRGASVIAPNLAELSLAVGRQVPQNDAAIAEAAAAISRECGVAAIIVKRSEDGVQAIDNGRTIARFPTTARRVVDVSGAGDTLVAALALSLAAGADMVSAVRIANAAAGIAVGKKGTASATPAELATTLLERHQHQISPKIFTSGAQLRDRVAAWQADGLSVGFTNGCFDLLHPGHIFVLTESRNRVDRLVLALNSDASVQRLKGPTRPVQHQTARITVAAALEAVDAVVLFEQDTPIELIALLRPNILFKGGDYRVDQVVGREMVEAAGGRVELIEYLPDTSTSLIIERIAEIPEMRVANGAQG